VPPRLLPWLRLRRAASEVPCESACPGDEAWRFSPAPGKAKKL
jgi:hypothetical protein